MMRGSNIGILPYDLSYYGHLGASCSSSIAVGTLLIGAILIYGHLGASCSSSIAVGTLLVGAMPKFIWSPGGFLFKHRSYSNQREHNCRYPLDRHNAKLTRGLLDRIRIIA